MLNFLATMSTGIVLLLIAAACFADAFAEKGGTHGPRTTQR
jgi:hypothetical protein